MNKDKKYHIGCGLFGIYAGILKNDSEWKDKNECTDEALKAVRDYMCQEFLKDGNSSGGYEWTRKDGKRVALKIEISE